MRIFIEKCSVSADVITILPPDSQHIARVLRMRSGEELSVCDGAGNEYSCVLDAIQPEQVTAKVVSCELNHSEPDTQITVYAAISKGDKFDWLLQKCVEIGVSRVVPFISSRCISRPDPRDYAKKRERYARIALEASKQAMRGKVVTVAPIVSFKAAVDEAKGSECPLFLYEKENRCSLSSLLVHAKDSSSFAVVTGPEGGFDDNEVAYAVDAGLSSVSVGSRILRCETAPVAAVCAIMYATGNFDI